MLNQAVCVKTCPMNDGAVVDCVKPTYMTSAAAGTYSDCQAKNMTGGWFRYDTYMVMNSFCLPNGKKYVSAENMDTIKNAFKSSIYG